MIVRGRGDQTLIETGDKTETRNIRFPEFVREYFSSRKLARRPDLAPLSGGAVGYFAYGAARWFEPALSARVDESCSDDAVLMFFRNVLAFDRARRQIDITSVVFTEEAGGNRTRLRELYERAIAETARIEELLNSQTDSQPEIREPQAETQNNAFVHLKLDARSISGCSAAREGTHRRR